MWSRRFRSESAMTLITLSQRLPLLTSRTAIISAIQSCPLPMPIIRTGHWVEYHFCQRNPDMDTVWMEKQWHVTVNETRTFAVMNIYCFTTTTILRPLYRLTCISWHPQLRTGGLCWCKVLAGGTGNQCNRIREKMLEFSAALSTLSTLRTICLHTILLLLLQSVFK